MERNLKPISTGNPNFREIIESNSLYIDKTKYIYNLVASKSIDKTYFLSRPRRFGKSHLPYLLPYNFFLPVSDVPLFR